MDLKLVGQWVLIIAAAVGLYVTLDRRVTSLEAGWVEERSGYATAIAASNDRLNRIENKLDRLIENRR